MSGRLDVSLTLRLDRSQLSAEAKKAVADLKSVGTAASGLASKGSGKLAGDLDKVAAAGAKASGSLHKVATETGALQRSGTATATFARGLDAAATAGTKTATEIRKADVAAQALGRTTGPSKTATDLESAAKSAGHLDATLRKIGGEGSGIDALDRRVKALAADLERAAGAAAKLRVAGGGRTGSGGGGGSGHGGSGHGGIRHVAAELGVAYGAGHLVREAISTQAKFAHESVRMSTAGMSAHEREEATRESLTLSGKNPSINQVETMHALRNARSIVGSYEEAAHVMEPLLKLRTIAMGAHPGAGMEEDFDKLVKGLEIKGVTQHMPEFIEYLDGMAKAVNAFGDTLKPSDYYEMFKYGRQSTQSLSKDFMLSVAPTIAQELGGASAGVAFSDFFSAIVGGHSTTTAAKEMEKLGLVTPDGAIKGKKGEIKHIKPGGVVGSDIAASDPYQWVQRILLPAFHKNGIVTAEAIQAKISQLFPNQVAAQLVSLLATQGSRIEKDRLIVHGAKGLDAAKEFQSDDPYLAWKAVKAQAENLVNALRGVEHTTSLLNTLAQTEAEWAKSIVARRDGTPYHPAPGSLQSTFNKGVNRLLYGDVGNDEGLYERKKRVEREEKAHREMVLRDNIDRRRGEIDAEIGGHEKAIAGYDAVDASGPMSIIGRSAREVERQRSRREIANLRARRRAIDDAVETRDAVNAELTDVTAGKDRFDSLRINQPGSTKGRAPGSGFVSFGIRGAPEQPSPFGNTEAPTPPSRPAAPAMLQNLDEVLNPAKQAAASAAGAIKSEMAIDLSAAAAMSMGGYNTALKAGGDQAVAAAQAIKAQITSALTFSVSPTITPRIGGAVGGGAGASPTSAPGASGGGGGTRSARAGGATFTGPIHVHGVTDLAGIHDEVLRVADRRARSEHSDALHDTGSLVG